jgi:ankyrin repeat protein
MYCIAHDVAPLLVATTMPDMERAYREDVDYYEDRARGLLASATDGTPEAVAAFEEAGAALTVGGARDTIARRHGLISWASLCRHLPGLRERDPFARAYVAIEAHDADTLAEELSQAPEIVGVRGTNGNDLLGMATATAQVPLVELLLARGADPSSANVHGWTALHQAAYVGSPELARMLLDAGAPVDVSARGEGGTPLVVALFWGHAVTAELLGDEGVHPRNLRAAAGLGRMDLVEELVGTPQAAVGRGFYRPHSGFPRWRPSDDDGSEVVSEALSWAARNDRVDVLDVLVSRGASIDADVYRGTALTWAAACGRVAAIDRLLALGADPNQRSTFGGEDHGDGATALHIAAGAGHADAARALLAGGADASLRDERHHGTPADWAEHSCGDEELTALLREHEA